jgi:C-terminal processing protease CtpA/Prc
MDSVNYGGRVFVLVDDGVFSSAETFAAFCKESGWATLVGECTGGDGIGFDPSTLTFPNSGMYILYSTTLGLNPDWSVNEQLHTRPDVLIERAPGDLLRYIQLQSAGPLPGPDPSWDTALRECLRRALGCKPHGLPAPRSSSEPFM